MSAPLCHSLPTVSDPGDLCADTLALHRGILCRARPWHPMRRNRTTVYAPRFWPSICQTVPIYEYENLPPWLERRPTKRSECPPPDQQCPWVSCRYHLALDAGGKKRPRVKVWSHPDDWTANTPTCALHVAEAGTHTLLDIGAIMGNICRERVRQLEQAAQLKLSQVGIILSLAEDCDLDTSAPLEISVGGFSARRINTPTLTPRTYREPVENLAGNMASEVITAKMRRAIANAQHLPIRTVTLPPEEIARVEAEIEAKRKGKPAPTGQRKPNVTADTFTQLTTDPRASERYARSRESLQSYRRLTAPDAPAKAHTTTTPRPPCNPIPSPIEIPPQVLPALVQSDDQPEVAVVSALPVDPQPTPPSPPMTKPDPRTRRTAYADAHETAQRNLAKLMAERGLTRDQLSALARDAYTAHTAHSVDQGVVRALHGTASPVSVWYRRLASLLGVPLSDLCSDPMWLAAVAPEDSPIASPHSHLHRPPAPPDTPPMPPIPDTESTLIPLLAEALRQAQAADRRTAELTALTGILRAEIDDLQQQLAERTSERDAATATLAKIKAAL